MYQWGVAMGIILSVCQQSRFGWQQTDGLQAFDARPLAVILLKVFFNLFLRSLPFKLKRKVLKAHEILS